MDISSNFYSAGLVEPTLYFTTKEMNIGENYPLEKLPISEIIKQDQLLLKFNDTPLSNDEQCIRRPVVAGVNTTLSEDKNELYAAAIGYPKVEFKKAEDDNQHQMLTVSIEPLFQLSKDLMTAFIVIKPLLFNYTILSSEDLYQLLTKSGITQGIDYKQLKIAKNYIKNKSTEKEKIPVAQGRKPVTGTDAHLEFQLEIGPIAGTLLENGRIDFRERKIMVPVHAGQKLAIKKPLTQGKPGMTVLGTRIAQQCGKDIEIETSGDALYNPEEETVIATADGVLSVVQKSTLKVCSKLEIQGDIDYSTGNIESGNSVVVHGSVLPGFLIKAAGDLEIKGSVTSTQVSSLANIVIKGGITGNVSNITSAGDTDIHFIEQGEIRCKGNCVIRKQSYYSNIYTGGNILCHEESTVVGGELIAEKNITLGNVGAPDADPILIAAGVSAERLFHSRKLLQRLEEYKDSIMQRLKGYKGLARKKELNNLKGGIEEMKLRSLRINMIPGTGLFSKPLKETDDGLSAINSFQNKQHQGITDTTKISIDVHGTIFAGSQLQIGNCILSLSETLSRQHFTLDDSQRHIISLPLD